jgi:hypothetical protein
MIKGSGGFEKLLSLYPPRYIATKNHLTIPKTQSLHTAFKKTPPLYHNQNAPHYITIKDNLTISSPNIVSQNNHNYTTKNYLAIS